MRIRLAYGLLAVVCLPLSAQTAQTWFKVGTESTVSSVVLPAGTTYRFGSGTSWCQVTTTAKATVSVYGGSPCPNGTDPAFGTVKELDVLETSAAQTITANGAAVTVPALPAPTPPATPAPAPTVTASWSLTGCILDFYSDGTAQIRSGCVVSKQ